MSRDTDRTEALRNDICRAIVDDTGMREILALPIASSVLTMLQREYAGRSLYIPTPPRRYDVLQIRAALERGEDPDHVRHVHGLSRAKLYELFPGGLPRPHRAGDRAQG